MIVFVGNLTIVIVFVDNLTIVTVFGNNHATVFVDNLAIVIVRGQPRYCDRVVVVVVSETIQLETWTLGWPNHSPTGNANCLTMATVSIGYFALPLPINRTQSVGVNHLPLGKAIRMA